jgi:hypothetical protein
MGSLTHLERNFTRVGWFIPPYMELGVLSQIAAEIEGNAQFTQRHLEDALARLYEPLGLATMVLHRYPLAPTIRNYESTICEAVKAHFLGLDHIAAAGLIPVIEGAGRLLASQRGINSRSIREVFTALALDCKTESAAHQIGEPGEVASMMDSFTTFARDSFFAESRSYPFTDGTNRHGILHGAYSDGDFGSPINFYKTIAGVDFLTLVSSFRANLSWLAPTPSPDSLRLAAYYRGLATIRVGVQV